MRVNVGDFVVINYMTFSGEITKGIFYVVYHESNDVSKSSTAFSAVKVSSTSSGYQIPISSNVFKFLKHDSFINCSSMHRFMENDVLDILGRGNEYTLQRIMTQLNSYYKAIDKQLNSRLTALKDSLCSSEIE